MTAPPVHREKREGSLETLSIAVGWVVEHPLLLGLFFVVGLVNALGELSVLLSIVGFAFSLFTGGVAHLYAGRIVAGEEPNIEEIVAAVGQRMLSLVGIAIVYGIVVGIGLVVFILPGVYIGLRLLLAFPACVIEGTRAFESLETSWDVAQGNLLKLFGIGFTGFLFAVVVFATVVFGGEFAAGMANGDESAVLTVAVTMGVLSAIIRPVVEMSFARVYLENRPL